LVSIKIHPPAAAAILEEKEIEMSAKDRLDIDYQSKYQQLKDMI